MTPLSGENWTSELLDLLFPGSCLGCARRLGPDLRAHPLLLCPRCRGQLRTDRSRERCPTCAAALPPARVAAACAGCRAAPPPFDRLIAAWSYRPPLDRVLRALKFSRLEFLADELAVLALDSEALGASGPWDLVVPVPLAPWRRLVRGFNQAERLAAALATRLRLPCREALARKEFAPAPQALLRARQRRRRAGRLRTRRPEQVQGRRILLVDDIATTGATLTAASVALKRSGAAGVTAFVFALTPPPAPARLS